MNYENKNLEVIFTDVARGAMKGLLPLMEEAIEMGLSERWEDIINAVVETNVVPAAVSPQDQLVSELVARIHELESMFIGTSCELPRGSVSVDSLSEDERYDKAMEELKEAYIDAEPPFIEKKEEEPIKETTEEAFDPFAAAVIISEDEVHDSLVGDKEFDPFNTAIEIDDDTSLIPVFDDSDIPPAPNFDEEEPVIDLPAPESKSKSTIVPSLKIPAVSPLKKDELKVVTYQVFDKEVSLVQMNESIKSVTNGAVRKMAFQLHNVMMQKNDKYQSTKDDKDMGKFYTQMIREWGLEIAAANGINFIKGDDGCAILIAKLFYSMHTENQTLISPALRFRNEEERKAAAEAYKMLSDESTRQGCMDEVNTHKDAFALDPIMYVGSKELSKDKTLQAGYSLLYARMVLTWANATGKTVCVFPEVRQENMKRSVLA